MEVMRSARCSTAAPCGVTATVPRAPWAPSRMCCATRPNGCSTGWTTRRGGFARALDVGGRGVVAPLLRARGIEVVSCDLSPAMAALNGGAAVAADEEFLPFADGQLRPGGGEPVAALGQRPAGRADPVAPRAASGRAAAGEPAGTRHAGGTAAGADRGRGGADRRRGAARVAVRRTARLRGTAAARRVSRCRSRTWRICGCSTPIRSRCCATCARPGRRTRCASATGACRPRALFPAALASVAASDGRVAATLRLACMTGWAP